MEKLVKFSEQNFDEGSNILGCYTMSTGKLGLRACV